MGVDDHDGDVVLHQLLDEVAAQEPLPPAGLGQDADVLLHHGVDVHLHPDVVAEQQAEVGTGGGVLLEPDDLLDQLVLGLEHGIPGLEGGTRDLQQATVIAVADDVHLGDDLSRRSRRPPSEIILALSRERSVLRCMSMTWPKDPSLVLMLDLDVLHCLYVANKTEVEVGGADVAEDHTNGVRSPYCGSWTI